MFILGYEFAYISKDACKVLDKLSSLTSALGILANEENSSTNLPISSTCFEIVCVKILTSSELIDLFEGENLDKDKYSQTYRIWYRDKEKTLKDSDVQPIHEQIRNALIKTLSAQLRS